MNAVLIDRARTHGLCVATPYGIVDAGHTASVWGEGPNVRGFAWAQAGITEAACLGREALYHLEHRGDPGLTPEACLYDAAQAWAAWQHVRRGENDGTRPVLHRR